MNKCLLPKWFNALLLLTLLCIPAKTQTNPAASLNDSPTTIMGFNHIGISVKNLDEIVAFYQKATDFELVKREKVNHHSNADKLYGRPGIAYETVVFKAPNMLLKLTDFTHQRRNSRKMLPQGPGMTHTCFQSPSWKSGYQKFKDAEIDNLWLNKHDMWMTQVAIMSPNLEKLAKFYQSVIAFSPNRTGKFSDNPRFDDIIDQDNMAFQATWFKMDGKKMLELMQYDNPRTPARIRKKDTTEYLAKTSWSRWRNGRHTLGDVK